MIRFEKMAGVNAGKCVIDYKNNLIWEVAQNDRALHSTDHLYTWYQTANNEDDAGMQNN